MPSTRTARRSNTHVGFTCQESFRLWLGQLCAGLDLEASDLIGLALREFAAGRGLKPPPPRLAPKLVPLGRQPPPAARRASG
jgi:hypothetical protein